MASSWIEVDSFALVHNVRVIRNIVADLPIWAVVKSNAYGHDLAIASEAFWRGGVDAFVVTDPEDAKQLSDQRYKLPILVLFPVPDSMLLMALERGWHLAVTSISYFMRLEHFAKTRQKQVKVHFEIETGMHRTGLNSLEVESILTKYGLNSSLVQPIGIFTHLFHVEDELISIGQISLMQELQFNLQRKKLAIPITHVFASGGLGKYRNETLFDAVRLGAALYGYSKYFPETTPALTWKTKIVALGQVKPGESVGYNRTYTAQRIVRTATIPVGFADGLDRRLSNVGWVLIRGKRCPIIGRVSMNYATIDVTGVLRLEEDEEVVLLGKQQGSIITLQHIEEWAGIVPNEFVTGINSSISRIKTK
jgi:alanine racemase